MIQAENLCMSYGPVLALNWATFTVNKGEVVGLLGPNGAGKSTTMKILTTYLRPTQGTAKVCGIDILEDPLEVRRRVGYLPEILPLYMDMEMADYLRFVGRARGLGGAKLRDRIEWVVEHCSLRRMFRKVIRELSKGYKQRTGLAQALIHDPEVVILDEPMSGLDPHQIIEIRQLVRKLAKDKTVILSTHIMQEAEEIADRVVIISRGSIVGNGTVVELRDRARGTERTKVSLAAPREEAQKALATLPDVAGVECLAESDGYVRFHVEAKPGRKLWRAVGALAGERGWKVEELGHDPLTLEETFLALTEHEGSPASATAPAKDAAAQAAPASATAPPPPEPPPASPPTGTEPTSPAGTPNEGARS